MNMRKFIHHFLAYSCLFLTIVSMQARQVWYCVGPARAGQSAATLPGLKGTGNIVNAYKRGGTAIYRCFPIDFTQEQSGSDNRGQWSLKQEDGHLILRINAAHATNITKQYPGLGDTQFLYVGGFDKVGNRNILKRENIVPFQYATTESGGQSKVSGAFVLPLGNAQ